MTARDPKHELLLVCGKRSITMKKTLLREKFSLFLNNPDLLGRDSYSVKANVTAEVFRDFLKAAYGKEIDISETNAASLLALCDEFGFEPLRADCDRILQSSHSSHPNSNPTPALNPNSISISSPHILEERFSREEMDLRQFTANLPPSANQSPFKTLPRMLWKSEFHVKSWNLRQFTANLPPSANRSLFNTLPRMLWTSEFRVKSWNLRQSTAKLISCGDRFQKFATFWQSAEVRAFRVPTKEMLQHLTVDLHLSKMNFQFFGNDLKVNSCIAVVKNISSAITSLVKDNPWFIIFVRFRITGSL
jgi:hypothetical protein